MVVQTESGLARHPATHLLIFSDEDFYLRLILYSFQPACIVSLQPPSLPLQPGWRQHLPPPQLGVDRSPFHKMHTTESMDFGFYQNIGNCTLKCM